MAKFFLVPEGNIKMVEGGRSRSDDSSDLSTLLNELVDEANRPAVSAVVSSLEKLEGVSFRRGAIALDQDWKNALSLRDLIRSVSLLLRLREVDGASLSEAMPSSTSSLTLA